MATPPIVSAPCGPIQGFYDGDVIRYRGIHFAKTPRFQPPLALKPWAAVLQATEASTACPQPDKYSFILDRLCHGLFFAGIKFDESTLQLSVTTPSDVRADEKLPVMIWIHGGAFFVGTGDAALHNPSNLVSEHRLIVVCINYRLGLWGFLGDGDERAANLGLLDQIAALRWVKRNIAAFGGGDDAQSITLFGQSAGASSIIALILASEARGFFSRAILQSAIFGAMFHRQRFNAALVDIARGVSKSSTTEEMFKTTDGVLFEALKWLCSARAMPFAPQYGYDPIPSDLKVDDTLKEAASKMDILVGSTDHECTLFMDYFSLTNKLTAVPFLGKILRSWLTSYFSRDLFIRGVEEFGRKYARFGGKVSSYRIHYAPNDHYGATHGIEIPLLFGNKESCYPSKVLQGHSWDQVSEAGQKLRKLWADFAKGKQLDSGDSVNSLISINRLD